ncbi:MAG TPA: GTP 3',8-cyclase MoaA [Polyangiaceae bacterium]|nr:GTP 3',8-cyclase MoaA [Polyangiaceae bacterium]
MLERVDAMKTLPVFDLVDRRGRPLRDLRVSVTDRCNFRCPYCMPRAVYDSSRRYLPRAEILSFEEIARTVAVLREMGLRKVRLTGGEPLLRAELPKLVRMLADLGEDLDLALTTNGSLLERHARALADAGLRRVTVSLDALSPDVFRAMSDTDVPVDQVLSGIDAALAAGLSPVKVNAVVRRGVNEAEIPALARRFRETGVTVRFIEYMDVGVTNGWKRSEVVPSAEVVASIDREFPLEPVSEGRGGAVAERWRYRDGGGEIGVISSVTAPFCGDCSRARLSADGHLYTCLFAARGTDLRSALRSSPKDDAPLRALLRETWEGREDRYSELRSEERRSPRVEMSYIGG